MDTEKDDKFVKIKIDWQSFIDVLEMSTNDVIQNHIKLKFEHNLKGMIDTALRKYFKKEQNDFEKTIKDEIYKAFAENGRDMETIVKEEVNEWVTANFNLIANHIRHKI